MKIAGRVATIIAATAAAVSLAFAGSAQAAPNWDRADIPSKSDIKAAAAAPTDPFYWVLSPKHMDLLQCVDLFNGGADNGAAIIQWDCHGLENQQFAPLFTVDGNSEGISVVFINRKSGKCIDLYNGDLANGTPIIQWTCHNGANQKWEFIDVLNDPNTPDDDTVLLKNRKSGKCLEVFNGSTQRGAIMTQWDCHSGANQQFTAYQAP
ncbi:RICIN domain-containing protein [Lentzea alba]|uniref:RICIN domain-containing protein n=1 Tax=Lentzea alba TaxID=2714351 RepID=UPI0039BF5F70